MCAVVAPSELRVARSDSRQTVTHLLCIAAIGGGIVRDVWEPGPARSSAHGWIAQVGGGVPAGLLMVGRGSGCRGHGGRLASSVVIRRTWLLQGEEDKAYNMVTANQSHGLTEVIRVVRSKVDFGP